MSKRKLLLADDSITIQKVVNLTFADEGIDVITAGDGDTAYEKISSERPAMVLADVNMPGMSGYDICERMRADDSLKDVPVVLLVGSFEPFDEAYAERVGANAYLTKPFQSIRQLVATVTDLMGPGDLGAVREEEITETQSVGGTYEEASNDDQKLGTDEESAEERTSTDWAATEPDDDIDSLYEKSFAEEDTPPEQLEGSTELADVGMDDEIIETSYTDQSGADEDLGAPATEDLYRSATDDESRVFDERPMFDTNGEADTASEVGVGLDAGIDESRENEYSFADETTEKVDGADELIGQYDDLPATEEFSYREPPRDDPHPEIERNFLGQETVSLTPEQMRAAGDFANEAHSRADDMNILEIPPATEGKTIEFTTTERAELMGSKKEVISISPDLMEIIVQKVVERIAQKY